MKARVDKDSVRVKGGKVRLSYKAGLNATKAPPSAPPGGSPARQGRSRLRLRESALDVDSTAPEVGFDSLADNTTLEKIYKVFVSSTYEDLRDERATLQRALLQINCLPVGMEIFPAADEETWEFLKDQIDDSDYYIVVIGGRYGSIAADGLSYTEKEYEHARKRKKPTIGFIHENRALLASGKVDSSGTSRRKLDRFIEKIKQRPTRFFTSPHQLALEVTSSFVSLIRQRPAVGYVRADRAADYKKYSQLLERNLYLEKLLHDKEMEEIQAPFQDHISNIDLVLRAVVTDAEIYIHGVPRLTNLSDLAISTTWGELFDEVCSLILVDDREFQIMEALSGRYARKLEEQISERSATSVTLQRPMLQDDTSKLIREGLFQLGLIRIRPFRETGESITVWEITEYGRSAFRRLSLMAGKPKQVMSSTW